MQAKSKQEAESPLGDDLLIGAESIAEYLFGDAKKYRARVYHMAGTGVLPTFKFGAMLCARRSTLRRHIEQREQTVEM
jgi:hypothetical protein